MEDSIVKKYEAMRRANEAFRLEFGRKLTKQFLCMRIRLAIP